MCIRDSRAPAAHMRPRGNIADVQFREPPAHSMLCQGRAILYHHHLKAAVGLPAKALQRARQHLGARMRAHYYADERLCRKRAQHILPAGAPVRQHILQRHTGFLAAQESVELSIFFQKKLGSGLFGGEGFIMQKISGHGLAFLEFDGSVIEYVLQPGQQIVVDTGYLAAMEATCNLSLIHI